MLDRGAVPASLRFCATLDVPLTIDTVERDCSVVLTVEGELDISTAPLLDEALASALATDAARILVDLDKLGFIDSTGLHVLIKHARDEEHRGRMLVTRGSPQVRRLFELSGAFEYLPFVSEQRA